MRLRVDQRLFLSYLLLISMVIFALVVGADSLLRRHFLIMVERDLRRELVLGTALYDRWTELAPDTLANVIGELSGRRVTIVAADGRVVGDSHHTTAEIPRMENHGGRPEVVAARAGEAMPAIRRSETIGVEQLYIASPSRRGEIVRFSVSLSEVDAAVGRVQRSVIGVGLVALLLAGLFSFGYSFAVTRPLRRIHAVASALAAGDLSQRLREQRSDELGDVADALDRLADELQRRLGQLEKERGEMQTLIDSMSEGVLAFTAEGKLRRANPAAQQMFSLPGQAQGIPPEAVARRPEFLRVVSAALRGEAVPPTELTSEGRKLLATAHPLPGGGAVLVLLDTSELRRLEGVRRDFLANASHELKTPLTAIRGYSETLLDPDLSPGLVRRFSEIVKANSDRLQHIVDDLLDLSRIESGGWRIEPEPVQLESLATDAWAELGKVAGERGIRLELDIESGSGMLVADPAALLQIFSNLLSNAVRYSPPGGSITVRARSKQLARAAGREDISATPEIGGAHWIEVEVRDTGSGIPKSHLPRIFERFYRVDPARSRIEGGTGLGLAIVKHLVEAHGGQVQAESEVGVGTTIRFTLPSATRTDPSAADKPD